MAKMKSDDDIKPPSSLSIHKDQSYLPFLTPGQNKNEAINRPRAHKSDHNHFMRRIKMSNRYDRRESFKLRSANPSYRRRKLGYMKTDNSNDILHLLKPELVLENPSLGSFDGRSDNQHSLHSNKSCKSTRLAQDYKNHSLLKCKGYSHFGSKINPELHITTTNEDTNIDNFQKYSIDSYIKKKKRSLISGPYEDQGSQEMRIADAQGEPSTVSFYYLN